MFICERSGVARVRVVFDLIACSTAQTERALAYVRDVSRGQGPKVIEQDPRSHGRAIRSREVGRLIAMSSAEVLRKYGLPEWMRPLLP